MGSSFLTLTNKLLNSFNEVELDNSSFDTTVGVHTEAKNAILSSIGIIQHEEYAWPFNATSTTQVLTIGQEEYDWPSDFKVADWRSFQIDKDTNLGINNSRLTYLNRDEWYQYYKITDDDANPNGLNLPYYVFEKHGSGFGVSPSPNKAYTVSYRYYLEPNELSTSSDVTTIPTHYNYVIIEGAKPFMYQFYDNPERASMSQELFKTYLKTMRMVLINKNSYMWDTRVKSNL